MSRGFTNKDLRKDDIKALEDAERPLIGFGRLQVLCVDCLQALSSRNGWCDPESADTLAKCREACDIILKIWDKPDEKQFHDHCSEARSRLRKPVDPVETYFYDLAMALLGDESFQEMIRTRGFRHVIDAVRLMASVFHTKLVKGIYSKDEVDLWGTNRQQLPASVSREDRDYALVCCDNPAVSAQDQQDLGFAIHIISVRDEGSDARRLCHKCILMLISRTDWLYPDNAERLAGCKEACNAILAVWDREEAETDEVHDFRGQLREKFQRHIDWTHYYFCKLALDLLSDQPTEDRRTYFYLAPVIEAVRIMKRVLDGFDLVTDDYIKQDNGVLTGEDATVLRTAIGEITFVDSENDIALYLKGLVDSLLDNVSWFTTKEAVELTRKISEMFGLVLDFIRDPNIATVNEEELRALRRQAEWSIEEKRDEASIQSNYAADAARGIVSDIPSKSANKQRKLWQQIVTVVELVKNILDARFVATAVDANDRVDESELAFKALLIESKQRVERMKKFREDEQLDEYTDTEPETKKPAPNSSSSSSSRFMRHYSPDEFRLRNDKTSVQSHTLSYGNPLQIRPVTQLVFIKMQRATRSMVNLKKSLARAQKATNDNEERKDENYTTRHLVQCCDHLCVFFQQLYYVSLTLHDITPYRKVVRLCVAAADKLGANDHDGYRAILDELLAMMPLGPPDSQNKRLKLIASLIPPDNEVDRSKRAMGIKSFKNRDEADEHLKHYGPPDRLSKRLKYFDQFVPLREACHSLIASLNGCGHINDDLLAAVYCIAENIKYGLDQWAGAFNTPHRK